MLTGARPGAVENLQTLYRETIVRHAAHPVGFKPDFEETHRDERFNPLCGDRVEVLLQLRDEQILAIGFVGEACAICMASASMMCEQFEGKCVVELREALAWLHEKLSGDIDDGEQNALSALLGVRKFPSRIRCVTLPWTAALGAIEITV